MPVLSWGCLFDIMSVKALSEATEQDNVCIHGTCVSVSGRGLLILGASGAGKSALALQLMAMGAGLVADDRVDLNMVDDQVLAEAVPQIRGLIEARGIGLLRAEPQGATPLACVVDLDHHEPKRLPEHATLRVLRQTVPLLRGAGVPNLAASLIQLLKMGRVDPEWPNT